MFLNALYLHSHDRLSIAILTFLNILFEGIGNMRFICMISFEKFTQWLVYFMSNNYLNDIIRCKFNFTNEEIASLYITLLKNVSFKLNEDTLPLMFNDVTLMTVIKLALE